jgi:hypothetical protein
MSSIEGDRAIDEIGNLDLTFVKSAFQEGHGYSDSDFDEAVRGLKRFFTLTLVHDGPLAVTNKAVDNLWHTFVLHTPQYRAFCARAFGEYLDHQPHGAYTPVPAEAFTHFINAHEMKYGVVEEFWLKDLPPAARANLAMGLAPKDLSIRWSGWTGRDHKHS